MQRLQLWSRQLYTAEKFAHMRNPAVQSGRGALDVVVVRLALLLACVRVHARLKACRRLRFRVEFRPQGLGFEAGDGAGCRVQGCL